MYTISRSQVSLLSPTPGTLFSGMCKTAGRARIRSACSGKQLRPRTARWKPERTEGRRVGRAATRACAAGSDFTTGRKPARREVVLATLSSEVWSRFFRAVEGGGGSGVHRAYPVGRSAVVSVGSTFYPAATAGDRQPEGLGRWSELSPERGRRGTTNAKMPSAPVLVLVK